MATTESTALFTERVLGSGFLETLNREIVLPSLMTRDVEADFNGKIGRTVDVRKPQVRTAATVDVGPLNIFPASGVGGPLQPGGNLPNLTLVGGVETYVPISIDKRVYDRQPFSDFASTMDLQDKTIQVVAPMVQAVARGLEDRAALLMTGATYPVSNDKTIKGINAVTAPSTADQFLDFISDLAVDLDALNVPRQGRYIAAGTQFARSLLRALGRRIDGSAPSINALQTATIANDVSGFRIVRTNAIAATQAYAAHPSAYLMAIRAPRVPEGATSGMSMASDGMAMTLVQDYLPGTSEDSILLSTFVGTAVNTDPGLSGAGNPAGAPLLNRAIKITVNVA